MILLINTEIHRYIQINRCYLQTGKIYFLAFNKSKISKYSFPFATLIFQEKEHHLLIAMAQEAPLVLG